MERKTEREKGVVHDDRTSADLALAQDEAGRSYLATATLASLLVLTALLVLRIVMHLSYPFALDLGEGMDHDVAWRVAQGGSIYNVVDKPPYFFTIYGPILPYLSGLVVWIFGPAAGAARLVTVVFYVSSSIILYGFVRRETTSTTAATIAALFFLVERHVYSRAGFLVTDYPAIFFSLLGLYLWRGERRYWAVVAFALAFFSKQTSLAAAAAAFIALFLEGKRGESARMFAVFTLLVTAGLAACGFLFGRAYFVDTIQYASVAKLEPAQSLVHVALALGLYFVPTAGWLVLLGRSAKDKRFLLPVLYFAFGALVGLTSGRVGASRSYFFDLAAAMSIITGYAWVLVEGRIRAGGATLLVWAVVAAQIFLIAFGMTYRSEVFTNRTREDFLHDSAVREAFRAESGIILCCQPGFDGGARAQNVSDDTYKLLQMVEAGLFSQEVFLAPVRKREFSMVIMPVGKGQSNLFTPELRQAVLENYAVVREAYGEQYLVPRSSGG